MSEKAFRAALQKRIEKFGGQAAYARHLGITRSFVSAVCLDQRLPNKAILNDLGYERVRTVKYEYRKVRK